MPLQWFTEEDQRIARSFWADKELKVFAVDCTAGPEKRPTYASTWYARARTRDGAVSCIKRDAFGLPAKARFHVRLAGPQELGCHPTVKNP